MKNIKESKSLEEVRNWKKAVSKDVKKLRGQALLDYYNDALKKFKKGKAA